MTLNGRRPSIWAVSYSSEYPVNLLKLSEHQEIAFRSKEEETGSMFSSLSFHRA